VANKIGATKDVINKKIAQYKARASSRIDKKAKAADGPNPSIFIYNYVDTFLGLLVLYPESRPAIDKLGDIDFVQPWRKSLLAELKKNPQILPKELQTDEEYVKIITFRAEEFYGQHSGSQRLTEAMQIARRIVSEIQRHKTKQLAKQLDNAVDDKELAP
jgi:hypothetical protein